MLVRLQKADASGAGILSYAVNWDTSSAPVSLPFGGHWRTEFTRDVDYFVLFLDAATGEHIYSLFPNSQFPWPAPETGVSLKTPLVTVRNVGGPNVLVTAWTTFGPETTVVECGAEQVITSTNVGPFSLTVSDANTGRALFGSDVIEAALNWTLLLSKNGVVLGHDLVSSTPFPSGDACG